ncbi:radical SAM protein [Candidatus Peregrinibacteria bacterium]|nr:radical SAM protein [Candidatus Peregrinibacteria bacterium]
MSILDQSFEGLFDDEVVAEIQRMAPDIVGLNPLSNQRSQVQNIALQIKTSCGAVTVIGGYDASFLPLDDYDGVDYLVRGPGVLAMTDLVDSLANKTRISIQGVASGNKSGIDEKMEQTGENFSLDQLPMPYRSDQYLEDLVARNEPISIVASVGCDWGCDFCSTPQMYPKGREERPLVDVLNEIDHCLSKDVKKFSFWDEDFFGKKGENIERANIIIQHIKRAGAIITFSFITTTSVIQAERMGMLPQWEGTLNRLYIGVEGGCKEALIGLGNKSCRNPKINGRAVDLVREHEIGLQIGFIMFNPYSTFEELEKSAKFLKDHNESCISMSYFHHLRPYPATNIYKKLNESNLLLEDSANVEIDRHTDIPYHFQNDLVNNETRMRDFAMEMGKISKLPSLAESDKLMNEIYMRLVARGISKHVFNDSSGIEKILPIKSLKSIRTYKRLRGFASKLNHNFFMDSLALFRDSEGAGFKDLADKYVSDIENILVELRELKASLPDVTNKEDQPKTNSPVVLLALNTKAHTGANQVCF